jgi:hypothetical protein
MSGSFKEALELCEKVDVESLTFTDRIKHEIKHASILKKSASYL